MIAIGSDTVMGTSAARALFWGVPAFAFFLAFIGFWTGGDGSLKRLLKLLGDASCSIYLSHLFVIMALAQALEFLTLDPDLIVLATLLASAVAGSGVYRCMEQPLLAARQQRIRRWSLRHVHPGLGYHRRSRAS